MTEINGPCGILSLFGWRATAGRWSATIYWQPMNRGLVIRSRIYCFASVCVFLTRTKDHAHRQSFYIGRGSIDTEPTTRRPSAKTSPRVVAHRKTKFIRLHQYIVLTMFDRLPRKPQRTKLRREESDVFKVQGDDPSSMAIYVAYAVV